MSFSKRSLKPSQWTKRLVNVSCILYCCQKYNHVPIIMYPLLYAPWTSSLDGYVRNINVAIIIIIYYCLVHVLFAAFSLFEESTTTEEFKGEIRTKMTIF